MTEEQVNFGIYFRNGVPHPEEIRIKMQERTKLSIGCTSQEFRENLNTNWRYTKQQDIKSINSVIKFKHENYFYFFKNDDIKWFPILAYINNYVIEDTIHIGHKATYLEGVIRLVLKDLGGQDYVFGTLYDNFSTDSLSKYCYYTYEEAIKMKGFY